MAAASRRHPPFRTGLGRRPYESPTTTPFLPMRATSNSVSSAGTGISKPLTVSVRPSRIGDGVLGGAAALAPSLLCVLLQTREQIHDAGGGEAGVNGHLPVLHGQYALPSQVSLAWNILLSVLKSAVYAVRQEAGWSGSSLPGHRSAAARSPPAAPSSSEQASRNERIFSW